jgi:hypothetical protein
VMLLALGTALHLFSGLPEAEKPEIKNRGQNRSCLQSAPFSWARDEVKPY